ncbi:MAG: MarR family transcriptional regulator [Cyclobacteriaceae bacterium]|nr:MarR family transcriptional regulator [Cyclobacteriaceae bacterium]
MSIEKDIKQKKFDNEFHKMAVNIMFTSSWLHSGNLVRLKPYAITPEQYNVLRILRGSHPQKMMLSEITSRMIDKSSNCTRLVEKLRMKYLLSREVCADNRRQVDIGITTKGLSILKKIDGGEAGWVASLKRVSAVEAKELNRILDKLRG